MSSSQQVFTKIMVNNTWGSPESVSGPGSTLGATRNIRRVLPRIIAKYGVKTLLDVPCGDYHWMKRTRLKCEYIGADIVRELINKNQHYANKKTQFLVLDAVEDPMPFADCVMYRDFLFHLPLNEAIRAIRNAQESGIKYLLCTSFPDWICNRNVATGGWNAINMQKPPFNFPAPLESFADGNFPAPYNNKRMMLWKLQEIKVSESAWNPVVFGFPSPTYFFSGETFHKIIYKSWFTPAIISSKGFL